MSAKRIWCHCFLDLQRAAISFYLNPKGKTHQVFLAHARQILENSNTKKARKLLKKLSQIEREVAHPPQSKKETQDLADKILTLGILIKS